MWSLGQQYLLHRVFVRNADSQAPLLSTYLVRQNLHCNKTPGDSLAREACSSLCGMVPSPFYWNFVFHPASLAHRLLMHLSFTVSHLSPFWASVGYKYLVRVKCHLSSKPGSGIELFLFWSLLYRLGAEAQKGWAWLRKAVLSRGFKGFISSLLLPPSHHYKLSNNNNKRVIILHKIAHDKLCKLHKSTSRHSPLTPPALSTCLWSLLPFQMELGEWHCTQGHFFPPPRCPNVSSGD